VGLTTIWRSRKPALALACVLFSATAAAQEKPAEWNLSVANRTEVMNHGIVGLGRLSSFYDPGTHILHESEIRYSSVVNGAWNSTLNSTIRYTDSLQFDPNYWSVQNLEWKFTDTKRTFNVGDYFANLSSYAMNKGIKGAAYQQNFQDDQNYLRVAYGTFDGQWAYLLPNSNDNLNEPMDRFGGGARYQFANEKWRIGTNLAHVRDLFGDKNRNLSTAYEQYVPALDWEYREQAFVLTGEHAYSNTNIEPWGMAGTRLSGSANKLALRASIESTNIDAQAERVTPDFMTLAGGATADRLRLYGKVETRIANVWSVFGILDRYNDNLGDRQRNTTYNTSIETGFKRLRAFGRRNMAVAVSYRYRSTENTDRSVKRDSDRVKLRFSDRYHEVVDLKADWERIIDRNHKVDPSSAQNNMYGFSINSRHEAGNWLIRPSFEFSAQENQNHSAPMGGFDITKVTRMAIYGDRNDNSQIGVQWDRNLAYMRSVFSDSQLNRFNAYWQLQPAWLDNGSLKFELLNSQYIFSDSNRDYREKIARVVLQWNFEKQSKPR
jgi:hypothetical protein